MILLIYSVAMESIFRKDQESLILPWPTFLKIKQAINWSPTISIATADWFKYLKD